VKNVYLLPDKGRHWDEIEGYLRGVNANVIHFREDIDPQDLEMAPPDLFIISEKSSSSLLIYRLRNHVIMVVREGGVPGAISPAPNNPKLVTVNWPITSSAFLKLSAELTRLAERRVFRALLRIFPAGGGTPAIGRSMDFSHSGMALRTTHHLAIGARVEISLSLPNMDASVRFPVQIARNAPDGEEAEYGARFIGLDEERRKILDEFIMQG
jgi:hypothetical protein